MKLRSILITSNFRTAQVKQAGGPRTEIVERNLDARAAKCAQHLACALQDREQ